MCLGCDQHTVRLRKMTAINSNVTQYTQPILGRRKLKHEKISVLHKILLWFVVKALKHILNQDFSTSARLGLDKSGHHKMFSSVPFPYRLDATSSTLLPMLSPPQRSPDIAKCPLEGKIASLPREKHCSKQTLELAFQEPPGCDPKPPRPPTLAPTLMPCSNHPPRGPALSQANPKPASLRPSAPGLPHTESSQPTPRPPSKAQLKSHLLTEGSLTAPELVVLCPALQLLPRK